ncbi:MAG TPA: carboxypeptidase regulatory-like domain-containing protein [Gemmatimonas sp.]|nr:carboxypeptidase regulatory-like domain-containing protein [Gemmatimonas sp.]
MRFRHFSRSAFFLTALLSLTPSGASAQDTPPSGDSLNVAQNARLVGSVIDLFGQPLANVELRFLGTAKATRSDAQGRFRFDDPPAGARVLAARLVGWVPVSIPVSINSGSSDTIPLIMRRFSRTLSTVEVRARTSSADKEAALLAERLMQMRTGTGKLFTRDDILRLQPYSIVELVRGVVGLKIEQSRDVITAVSTRGGIEGGGTSGGSGVKGAACPIQFYLDGQPVDNAVIANLSPLQWRSVEVHPNTALLTGLPVQKERCGAIVIHSAWR